MPTQLASAPRARKFIPDADGEFATMAERFAAGIAREPQRYMLTAGDAEQIAKMVARFREAFTIASTPNKRTKFTIEDKDSARAMAERTVRKYGAVIRANPDIPTRDKEAIDVYEKPAQLSKRAVPREAPWLSYHGPGIEAALGAEMTTDRGAAATHILKFRTQSGTRGRPEGAVRVEIFVDLVPPGEKIPRHPAERTGRPWYLRSFTTSRMEVAFPMPSEPMLVVYWARWASTSGEVSRFSRTCIARQEGWTSKLPAPRALPEGEGPDSAALGGRVETKYVFIHTPIAGALPDHLGGDGLTDGIAALADAGRESVLEAAAVRLLVAR